MDFLLLGELCHPCDGQSVLCQCCCRKDWATMGVGTRIAPKNGSEESLDPCGHLASFLRGHFL